MKNSKVFFLFAIIILSLFLVLVDKSWAKTTPVVATDPVFIEEDATVKAIKKVMPSVVSITVFVEESITTVDLTTGKQNLEKNNIEKGSGTGFLISADGLILTNKHVAQAGDPKNSSYRIILNSGKRYYAQFIGVDPINDLAILKIFDKNLPFVELGDSDKLDQGRTVMAIGNTLGKYQNSVTKGIVSGLGRSLVASDSLGNESALDNVIQTDAEINLGNSGGPLIDLNGRVVGVNVAMDQAGVAIGFAIPINDAKPVIKSVREVGRIIRPRLGIKYVTITPELAAEKNLKVIYGALITKGDLEDSPAIVKDSPADKAGLQEGDIITEINGIKLTERKTLLSVVQTYKPGAKIGLRILRGDKIIVKIVELDEFK